MTKHASPSTVALSPEETHAAPSWQSRSHDRVVVLDGIRGLAIVMVMALHQTVVLPNQSDVPFDKWFFGLGCSGWVGVDLFFVLSGYLITGILMDSKNSTHYFRNFYMRRTVRIFPLYYAVVFLSLVIIPNLPEGLVPAEKLANFGAVEGNGLWYWLYLSNFSIAATGFKHGILDISWSLAIEEQFYLIWPIIVLVCSRKVLLRVCIAAMVVALATRIGLTVSSAQWQVAYVVTPARMDLLAIGAWIAAFSRGPCGIEAALPLARRLAVVCALGLAIWFGWHGILPVGDPLYATAGYTVQGLLFGALLVLVVCAPSGHWLAHVFSNRVLTTFGKYSYALYLFHVPLRAVLRDTIYGPDDFPIVLGSQVPGQLLFYVLATAITFPVAFASWHLFEKHFLKLKKYFPPHEQRAAGRDANPQS